MPRKKPLPKMNNNHLTLPGNSDNVDTRTPPPWLSVEKKQGGEGSMVSYSRGSSIVIKCDAGFLFSSAPAHTGSSYIAQA
eukprot:1148786-Pelagomonas_calceolata.AAC.5